MRLAFLISTLIGALALAAAHAAGDLSRQTPIEVVVELGQPSRYAFSPNKLRFETGKLYKLVLRNDSNDPHYFTSHGFSQMILHAQGADDAEPRRQGRHARGIQGRYPRDRGLSRSRGGMVVRAGGGRPRRRSALRRQRHRRQDACRARHDRLVIE
jgi:hypothetical protein